ncbi:MAG: hypothetical protein G01um101444_140 [Parcubacteria group bacterium Gr01-1014_44]|nr:MAG: hypothetical protein G01um101444_140 [Parcubacteria group bacterium Gr01-1014_44]
MNFFETFFSLVRLFLSTKDEFLKQKLEKKTREFFHVAQSVDNKLAIKQIDDLNEFIEILLYLKASDLSPALLAQKNLLCLYAEILGSAPVEDLPEEKEVNYIEKPPNKTKNLKYKNLETEILQIFQDKPNGLFLREIISSLQSQCSRRTVQRHLNKLVAARALLKRGDKNFVKYIFHGHRVQDDHVGDK